MWLKQMCQKHPKVGNAVLFLSAAGVCSHQYFTLAQTMKEEPIEEERLEMVRPDSKEVRKKGLYIPEDAPQGADKPEDIGFNPGQKFKSITTKAQACKAFEGMIVTYYDITSLISNCKQRQIEDPHILTTLLAQRNLKIEELPASIYRLIPFGDPYTREDLLTKRSTGSKTVTPEECNYFEKKLVSASGLTYYYVENCKLRAFEDYYALQEFNTKKDTLISVSPDQLSRFSLGKPMDVSSKREEALLMKMNGDVGWSRLNKGSDVTNLKSDNPESLWKIEKNISKSVSKSDVCKTKEGTVVSFYSRVYLISNCTKRLVSNFNINIQKIIEEKIGSIEDLTNKEYQSLPEGKNINTQDLLSNLKSK
jgi:hypothetical protein